MNHTPTALFSCAQDLTAEETVALVVALTAALRPARSRARTRTGAPWARSAVPVARSWRHGEATGWAR